MHLQESVEIKKTDPPTAVEDKPLRAFQLLIPTTLNPTPTTQTIENIAPVTYSLRRSDLIIKSQLSASKFFSAVNHNQ